jgi:hypothetical protein
MTEYNYIEHSVMEVEGFRIVDATATGPRPHDDYMDASRQSRAICIVL